MKTAKFLMIVMLLASFTTAATAQEKVDPTGTWAYTANQAPYEYSSGDIVITKEGEAYTVEIKLGDYYKVEASSVKYEENQLSFVVSIEGEAVDIKATIDKDSLEGTASYSEGTIPVTAEKKE